MPEQPNVLFVTCHDLGQHVGCYGVPTVRTPSIDGLAADGARFENSFCVAPQCSPSRASIATGQYPHRNGVLGLTHSTFAWDLDDPTKHVAARLGEAGWHTVRAGVAHETRHPERVFDETIHGQGDCGSLADAVCAFLSEASGDTDTDEPFYLQVGFFEPHRAPQTPSGFGRMPDDFEPDATVPPYLADEPGAREEVAAFEGAIERVDGALGRVLDALCDAGLADDTLVVCTTDHGIPFPRAKCSPYDPGIETALVMRFPDCIPTETVYDEPIANVDYLPTLFALLDQPVPDDLDGRSFAPLLTGGEYEQRERVFGELTHHDYPDPRRWVRTDEFKLVVNFASAPFFMDPTQTWRPRSITTDPPEPALSYHEPVELYDLRTDPLETENVATDPNYENTRRDLLSQLHEWMDRTSDPLLDGIPAPPMHELATQALREGTIPSPDALYREQADEEHTDSDTEQFDQ